jgi:pimeloyl-ACP methyl ester carboxylesterase
LRRAFSPQPLPDDYFRWVASSWLGRKKLKAYLDDESSPNASLKKLSSRYPEITVPVVILTGDHDQIVSATENAYRLKDSIANSQLVELKDTGHEIPQTCPESISSALSLITSPISAVRHKRE